jgi:glycosyltransferase involved in cell wall biosynthesis
MKNKNILIIGGDLTSNGGIASVIKAYYSVYSKGNYPFKLFLLKTYYYKDKSQLFELLIFAQSIFRFFRLILTERIKLLHIHSSADISFVRKSIFVLFGRILNKKIILHIHSSKFYDFFMSKNKFLVLCIKFILYRCDLVIVLCNDWEQKLKLKYPNAKIQRLANPVVLPQAIEKIINLEITHKFTFLFVGFFIESKGIKDLLEVSLLVKNNNINDLKIQIAGKGELEGYIKQYVDEHELNAVVELVGWVSGKKKEELYRSADVFVLPSYKEGMPISILEAMSYGLPVLSTNIAGIPDIITNNQNGFMITPGDQKALFERLIYFKDNNRVLDQMRKHNLKIIVDYSDENVFHKMVEIYQKYL